MFEYSRQDKAFCHWFVDGFQCCSVLLLLACWMADAGHPTTPRFLDSTFLTTGFCNHPVWDTQWWCSMLDFCGGALFVLLAFLSDNGPRKEALATAAYLFSHGYGHFELATRETGVETPAMANTDLLVLAAILYIGPIHAARALNSVGGYEAYTTLIRVVSVLSVAALVFGYKIFLGNHSTNYALLYINISIILTKMLPRCFLIGYTKEAHVRFRVDQNGPYFWSHVLARNYLGAMILLEPFGCSTLWVQEAGGHLLFDSSLFLDSLVTFVNQREQNKKSMVAGTASEGDKVAMEKKVQ